MNKIIRPRKLKTPHALGHAAESGNIRTLQSLLSAGFDPNFQDIDRWTPLMRAARAGRGLYAANPPGRLECVHALLASGADPNLANTNQKTPLWVAAETGMDACVSALIQAGAQVDYLSRNETTPAMSAAKNGHVECMRLLLEAGADPRRVDTHSRSLAVHSSESFECLSVALSFGVDPLLCDLDGMDALDHATCSGNVLGLRALLASGCHVNRPPRTLSLLSHACLSGRDSCAALLLDSGFDPNETTSDGSTPLILAAGGWSEGAQACVQLLLARGVHIDARDREGNSPLMAAAIQASWSVLLLLAQADARMDFTDAEGRSAADLLREAGEEDMAATLSAIACARSEKKLLTSIVSPPRNVSARSPRI